MLNTAISRCESKSGEPFVSNPLFDTGLRKRDKLPLTIIRYFRNMILDGRLKPGDKLPSEQELVKMFSVSRQTIREVLRVLEAQGLMQIRPGACGGIFVREVDIDITRQSLIDFLHQTDLSLQHVLEVRRLLDPYFAEMAALNMDSEEVRKLSRIVEAQKAYIDKGELENARKEEIKFHQTLACASDNPLLILLQDFIENLLMKIKSRLSPDEEFSLHSYEMHSRIVKKISQKNIDDTRIPMLADLDSVEHDLLKLGAEKDKLSWQ